MAIDPRILLMGQSPDVIGSFSKSLGAASKLQDLQLQPKRNQLIDLQMQGQKDKNRSAGAAADMDELKSQYMPVAMVASKISQMGGANAQNAAQINELLINSGSPQESLMESQKLLNQGMQSNDFTAFNAGVSNVLKTAQDLKIFGAPKPKYTNMRVSKDGKKLFGMTQQGRLEQVPIPEGAEFGGSNTTINLGEKGRSEEQKALSKSRVKRYDKLFDDAENAIDQNELLKSLVNVDVTTGFGVQTKAKIASFFNMFDPSLGEIITGVDATAVQVANAITSKMVNSELNNAKGPQTEGDAIRARQTVATIDNEKDAYTFIISQALAINDRRIEQHAFYADYLDTNETFKGADKSWADYKRKTPMLSDVVKNEGLPMFFNEFKQQTQARNPNASDERVVNMWRDLNGGMSLQDVQAKYKGNN